MEQLYINDKKLNSNNTGNTSDMGVATDKKKT